MKILAVDYGDSRTGLATCDRTEFLTTAITPQITLKARNKVAARVCEVAKEIGAELIVIGLPLNMDGTEGERAIKSRKLAKTVEIWSASPLPSDRCRRWPFAPSSIVITAIRLLELFVMVTVYGPSVMISPFFHVDALAARL